MVRRRVVRRPSGVVAGSNPAVVSPMMEPLKLTGPSRFARAGRRRADRFAAT